MFEGAENDINQSEVNANQSAHLLEDAPSFEEHMQQIAAEKTQSFYEGLGSLEDEPHYPEAAEIYDMMNWESFPDDVEMKTASDEKFSGELKQSIEQIKAFGKFADENPAEDGSNNRNVGADDRLILGDKYNNLVSTYKKVAEHRTITPVLSKRFCHDLAAIVHDYEEDKEIWQIIGEKNLKEAFVAYEDVNGADTALEDLGASVPEHIDRYTIMPLVAEINNVVRQDWQKRITPIESYKEGAEYSLICSRIKEPFAAQESRNKIFSGSLLTDSYHKTIGDDGNFGFVLPPDHIIAAAPNDIYTHNWSDNDETSLRTGVPVVMSYDRVLRESQQKETYSEVTTRDLPVGIFYIKEKINEEDQKKIEELVRLNPDLPVVGL